MATAPGAGSSIKTMHSPNSRTDRVLPAVLCLGSLLSQAPAQAQNPQPPSQSQQQQSEEVVRINTELVQTDVTVLDRRGRFVDGLRPEQFTLSLDGQKRAITSFERVTSGNQREASQLAAARAGSPTNGSISAPVTGAKTSAGRLVFFFVDDIHLSGESLARARKALLHYVDNRMNEGDRVAVVSTSGQIGFLQQLSDNPAVLHEAISRLTSKRNPEGYAGKTRITEFMASQMQEGGNRQLFAYLMESVKIEYGMGLGAARGDHGNDSAGQARRLLKSRIGQIGAQSKLDTANTISVLQSLMQSSASLPGRKLVFFMSDGFVVDPRGSNALNWLHEATQLAARTGAVIYSVDMRGSFVDAAVDASSSDYIDMTSRHAGVSLGEVMVPREPLNVLSDETGGRTIVNTAGIDDALLQAVHETSDYYLLAWRPSAEGERNGKAKIEIAIPGRPDLRVRLRRSYYVPAGQDVTKAPNATTSKAPAITPETQLLTVLGSAQPLRTLPTSVSVGYVRGTESELMLQTSMQIPREAFVFDPSRSGQKTEIDVIGAAIDDRGLIYTFKQVLTVTQQSAVEVPNTPVIWNQQLKVKPGLYQVRIAVRERLSGRSGSAMEWIEIPAAAPAGLSMSSLFLGERQADAARYTSTSGPQPISVDVDRHFARTSVLRFQTYVYNAARNAGSPDVWIEAQILRGSQQVMRLAPSRVPPEVSKDTWRLPYWSEIALNQLPPGSYSLKVSATDRVGGASASQRILFSVE